MSMEVESTEIDGVLILRPRVFADPRGHFLETYNKVAFQKATGLMLDFTQDNESLSSTGVLRGLHFQEHPHAQGKLVRVSRGAVIDVAVDIRAGSPTLGRHVMVRLDDREKKMLWVPPGLAHGFLALEDDTLFHYKCSAHYHQPSERTIRWDDPQLAIPWPEQAPLVSEKDIAGMTFAEYLRHRNV